MSANNFQLSKWTSLVRSYPKRITLPFAVSVTRIFGCFGMFCVRSGKKCRACIKQYGCTKNIQLSGLDAYQTIEKAFPLTKSSRHFSSLHILIEMRTFEYATIISDRLVHQNGISQVRYSNSADSISAKAKT